MNCKDFFMILGFICLLFLIVPIRIPNSNLADTLEDQFTDYLKQFNKSYNETLYPHRFNAFKQSVQTIDKLNSQRKHNLSALYGLTKFSDMTPEEFLDKHLQSDLSDRILSRNSEESQEETENHVRKGRDLKNQPPKVDWREKGVVTKVNNQKLCGACWAFSTVENMESMHAIRTGKLTELSIQQIIDCAGNFNDGCSGGDACLLLEWLKDNNVTVLTEQEYPLRLKTEECKAKLNTAGVRINQFACDRMVGDEDYILAALARVGPVAVAINALTWQYYLGGVIQFHCGGSVRLLNHAVQIVGYDLAAEIPHYIVRNSWGEDFGDKGYLYIAIGDNLCGLANEVTILTVL